MKLPLSLFEELNCIKQFPKKLNLIVTSSHESILLYGRYTKFSREVSQTPWSVDDGQTTTLHGSVEEHLQNAFLSIFGSKTAMLHASGREDIDVRMLGRGRPFVMEFHNPTKAQACHLSIAKIQNLVCSPLVSIADCKIVNRKAFESLKLSVEDKAKAYCAIVWVQREISEDDCLRLSTI